MKTHDQENPRKYEIYKFIRKMEKNYFPQTILRDLEDMVKEYRKEVKNNK